MSEIKLNSDYVALITHLKEKVKTTQLKAAMSVNREVIGLYWYIGKKIIEKQKESNWGSGLVETISRDLQNAFPETQGFSVTNLKRMKIFANDYPDQIGAQAVHQLPWGHIVFLIHKIKELDVREWYAQKTIAEGWSRSTLEMYVKRGLYQQHN